MRYRAKLIVDGFEPGRCHLHLDRVVYSTRDAESSQLFGYKDHTLGDRGLSLGNSSMFGVPRYLRLYPAWLSSSFLLVTGTRRTGVCAQTGLSEARV